MCFVESGFVVPTGVHGTRKWAPHFGCSGVSSSEQGQGAGLIHPIPIESHTEEGYIRRVCPQPGVAGACLPRACAQSVLGKCLFIYFMILCLFFVKIDDPH